jgi:hypothetical protein
VRRLYTTDALGIVDEDLIEEVGSALLARCESILAVTAAHYGQIQCPQCAALIVREGHSRGSTVLVCARCDWSLPWADYHRTYRGRQLFGANAVGVFRDFVARFPTLTEPRARMLAIDRLLHEFHTGLREDGRPVAANLLEGTLREVIAFLDTLSADRGHTNEVRQTARRWQEHLQALSWAQNFVPSNADAQP